MPIYEPGLDELVARNAAEGRLIFTTDVGEAVRGAEVVFIAVGTPPGPDGSADLRTCSRPRDVGEALTGFAVIVTKSTVPVGTADKIEAIDRAETKHPFAVASNPEFLKEGDAVNDFMKPARVVIGADDERAIEALRELYAPFCAPTIACRSWIALRRADQVRRQLHARDADLVHERARAPVRHPRRRHRARARGDRLGPPHRPQVPVRRRRLRRQLLSQGPARRDHTGARGRLQLESSTPPSRVNERQKRRARRQSSPTSAATSTASASPLWGLAFKPETDDIRESPALVADRAAARRRRHGRRAHDPVAMPNVRAPLGDGSSTPSTLRRAPKGADALVLVTEWHELRDPDFERLKSLLKQPVIFDGRNVWSPAEPARRLRVLRHRPRLALGRRARIHPIAARRGAPNLASR